MKLDDLFETPQNTFPTEFGMDNDADNKAEGRKLLKSYGTKNAVKKIDGFTLWELKREYALIRDSDSYVAYYMRFQFDMIPLIKRQCVRQITVWRSKSVLPVTDITKQIFNDLIFKYQTVITDAEQTEDGRRFWLSRIREALDDSSLFVYYINISHPKEIIEVKSMNEYADIVQGKPAYGDKRDFQNRRFIITSKPFDNNSNK